MRPVRDWLLAGASGAACSDRAGCGAARGVRHAAGDGEHACVIGDDPSGTLGPKAVVDFLADCLRRGAGFKAFNDAVGQDAAVLHHPGAGTVVTPSS